MVSTLKRISGVELCGALGGDFDTLFNLEHCGDATFREKKKRLTVSN